MRHLVRATVLVCVAGALVAACVGSNNPAPPATSEPDAAPEDATSPGTADGSVEASTPADSTVPDAADASTPAVDSSLVDSAAGSDASSPLDASNAADASDASSPVDASDASPPADAAPDTAGPLPFTYALSFDDTIAPQYVSIPDAVLLNLAGDFTIEAWVEVTGPGHTSAATIVAKPFGSGGTDTSTIWFQSGDLYAAVNLGGIGGADGFAWTASDDTWHHVAWTYANATGVETLYLDGVSTAQATSTAGMPAYDVHPFLIGADIDFGSFTYGLQGIVDDVRIFSTVRTQGEILVDETGQSPVGDPALVAYYPFDEGSGTILHDYSGHGLDGTLSAPDAGGGAPTWVSSLVSPSPFSGDAGPEDAGATFYALEFEAEPNYVALPDNSAIDLTSAFTYEAWINPTAASVSGVATILAKPYGGGGADSTAVWFQSGDLYAAVNLAGTGGANAFAWTATSGTWHFVAWTFAGTTNQEILYVDGTAVSTVTNAAGAPAYDSHPFLVGSDIDNGAYGYGFDGLISRVCVFSGARTAAQIQSDMTSVPVTDATLVLYYPLDEGSGAVANDGSGHGLDGTLGSEDAGGTTPTWVVVDGTGP